MAKPPKQPKVKLAKTPSKKNGLRKYAGNLFGTFFRKRSIIIISDHKTSHLPISAVAQAVAVIGAITFIGWASYSSGSYMAAQKVLDEKDRKLATTTEQNERVGAEFELLKRDLMKLASENKSGELADYAKMMTEQFAEEESALNPEFAAGMEAAEQSEKYNAVFQRIEYLENRVKELQTTHDMMMADIRSTTGGKIAELERVIAATGIDKAPLEREAKARQQREEQRKEKYGRIENGRGGPYEPVKMSALKEKDTELYFNLKRMMTLNEIVSALPIDQPMSLGYRRTSSFGTRVDPFRGRLAFHSGMDLAGPRGAPIKATSDGKITYAAWKTAYGNVVDVQHDFGFSTRYGHLSKILVKPGQYVKKGDVIAIQGSTGRSTGNHLHYEVRYNNKPINPSSFLKAGTYVRS